MPRPPARLTNCYTPLLLSEIASTSASQDETPTWNNLHNASTPLRSSPSRTSISWLLHQERSSGDLPSTPRGPYSLRHLRIESNILPVAAVASALVELGYTKVLVTVQGPLTATDTTLPSAVQAQLNMDHGIIHVEVKYAAYWSNMMNATTGTGSTITTANTEAGLAGMLHTALAAAVPLQHYPKCAWIVSILILQDDGNVFTASVAAATTSLAQAAVEMYDLPAACSVAIFHADEDHDVEQGHDDGAAMPSKREFTPTSPFVYLADPTAEESKYAHAMVTLAMLPQWKDVTVWEQQTGAKTGSNCYADLEPAVVNRAMELCRDGCRTMHRFVRAHLIEDGSSATIFPTGLNDERST